MYRFLIINPGSTSTKLAVYHNDEEVQSEKISHDAEFIQSFDAIYDQFDFRLKIIEDYIEKHNLNLYEFTAVVGRGGNMEPVVGGTYEVNEKMIEDLKVGVMGQHASNLGGGLAYAIAKKYGLKAYVVDPVVVDEFEPLARISGSPLIERKSKHHPLNQRAVARLAASEMGGKYEDFNFIVAHMGGGISVGVHKKGRIVDVNNCLNGDGPMSPERSGGLPFGSVIDLCFSGKYTKKELEKQFVGQGGLVGYLGTNDAREVVERIKNGDEYAKLIYEALAYQVAKEIGSCATVLKGNVDAILLTGGLAYDDLLTGWIEERVKFIAPIRRYPGEHEMKALAQGVMRVLDKVEELQVYPNPKKDKKDKVLINI